MVPVCDVVITMTGPENIYPDMARMHLPRLLKLSSAHRSTIAI